MVLMTVGAGCAAESLEGVVLDVVTGRQFVVIDAEGDRHTVMLAGIDIARKPGDDCQGADGSFYFCEDHAHLLLKGLIKRGGGRIQCLVLKNEHLKSFSLCKAGGRDLGQILLKEGRVYYSQPDLDRVMGMGMGMLPVEYAHIGTAYAQAENEAADKRLGLWNDLAGSNVTRAARPAN